MVASLSVESSGGYPRYGGKVSSQGRSLRCPGLSRFSRFLAMFLAQSRTKSFKLVIVYDSAIAQLWALGEKFLDRRVLVKQRHHHRLRAKRHAPRQFQVRLLGRV